MALGSLWFQLKRLRRRIWPAERGTFRRAVRDAIVGFVFLVIADKIFNLDYSYLLTTADKPWAGAAAFLGWTTLGISALATAFLVGCCITRIFASVYSFLPWSWRSSRYRDVKR